MERIGSVSTQRMWRDTVDPILLDHLSEREKKRQEALYELISTEEDYLRDLGIIIDTFRGPLVARRIVSDKEVAAMFSNVDMLRKVHEVREEKGGIWEGEGKVNVW